MRKKTLLVFAATFLTLGLVANAYPGMVVCAITTGNTVHSNTQEQLLQNAEQRIVRMFGATGATPTILFFDRPDAFWPLRLNDYGSTSFLGFKTCIAIGSKGQNIDVTAHELMHAEIAHRVGYWQKFLEMPIWFDEGLAMQVDFRDQYTLANGSDALAVKSLITGRDFFVGDNRQLTQHYASAKYEVAQWTENVGANSVYSYLDRLKAGESFDSVWNY